jgi:hypothetical protein
MTDYVGSAPDLATFQAAAQSLGFAGGDGGIITVGTWQGSKGSWFLNVVGDVPDRPGFWARLRWNEGDLGGRLPQFIAALRSKGIIIYEQKLIGEELIWTADGSTPGPEWVGDIGVIM